MVQLETCSPASPQSQLENGSLPASTEGRRPTVRRKSGTSPAAHNLRWRPQTFIGMSCHQLNRNTHNYPVDTDISSSNRLICRIFHYTKYLFYRYKQIPMRAIERMWLLMWQSPHAPSRYNQRFRLPVMQDRCRYHKSPSIGTLPDINATERPLQVHSSITPVPIREARAKRQASMIPRFKKFALLQKTRKGALHNCKDTSALRLLNNKGCNFGDLRYISASIAFRQPRACMRSLTDIVCGFAKKCLTN
jgi:hypothetical protein